MMRLLFLIGSLNRGGAERQLTLLVKHLDRTRYAVTVVTMQDGGALAAELREIPGVEVISVHKKSSGDNLLPLWRLATTVLRIRPRIVHGYLDVSNLLALAVGKMAGAKVVWGLRASNVDFALYDRRSARLFRLATRLSRWPDLIVANSEAGRRHHVAQGYRSKHLIVIPNGFDTDHFAPDATAGLELRRQWGIAPEEAVVGLVARLDPIKDHQTFLEAAAIVARTHGHVRFVCVGGGTPQYQQTLQRRAEELGLDGRIVWAGELTDMRAVHNALDIATSSSLSEGFSNTVGEAMACGVPCVVTDVGDSAALVGDTGGVVPVGNPRAMAAAWEQILLLPSEQRLALGRAARARIEREYSARQLARRTEVALDSLF